MWSIITSYEKSNKEYIKLLLHVKTEKETPYHCQQTIQQSLGDHNLNAIFWNNGLMAYVDYENKERMQKLTKFFVLNKDFQPIEENSKITILAYETSARFNEIGQLINVW